LRESMAIFEQRSETCLQKYPAVERRWWKHLLVCASGGLQ
jgi:hypothetical protein